MNIKAIRSKQDFDAYINRTPYQQLMQDYYETILAYQQMLNEQPQKIRLTVGQFLNMFEIQGMKITEDGEIMEQLEKRGRKRTILTEEQREEQRERVRAYQRKRYQELKREEEENK